MRVVRVVSLLFVSGFFRWAKKKGGHAAHPFIKEATQFLGRVL